MNYILYFSRHMNLTRKPRTKKMPNTECLINPSRFKGEPEINGPVLFLINPGEARPAMIRLDKEGAKRHFLFNSELRQVAAPPGGKELLVCGPAVGAPMAVMTMEKLISLGATQFIIFGWCGSLTPGIGIGQAVVPTWALSEEGTSAHYPVKGRPESSVDLRQKATSLLEDQDLTCQQGPIWTTDAPFRETREKVQNYGKQGILAVDMEYAALCTLAAFRQVEMAACMLVSDELWQPDWRPGFTNRDFKTKSRQLVDALLKETPLW